MRIFLTVFALLILLFTLNACPKTEVEDTGGAQIGDATPPPPPPPSYKASKLASLGRGKVGMTFDEVKGAYSEESGYKVEEPMPDAENPMMITATPINEANKLSDNFGLLNGEVVYIIQTGKISEDEYNAKIGELTAEFGEPVKEIPEILKATKFFSGETEEPEGGEDADGEKATPEDTPEGMEADLPENAVFWVDEAVNLVILAGLEDGEAGFMLLRTDKIDEQFEEFNRIMQEMYNKMFEDMSKGMDGATPPADGEAPPADTEESGE